MAIGTRTSGVIGGAARGAQIGSSFGPIGTGIGAALGGLGGAFGDDDQEDTIRDIMKRQREMLRTTFEFNQRQMRRSMDRDVATVRAVTGGRNVQFGGSVDRYASALAKQYREDMAFEGYKYRAEDDLIRLGANVEIDAARSAGMANMISALGGAAASGAFGTYSRDTGYTPPWRV